MKRIFLVSMVGLMIWANAGANLKVVADSGDTVDASQYLKDFQGLSHPDLSRAVFDNDKNNLSVNNILYPVKSSALPGKVEKRKCVYLDHPIFVVGSDTLSKKWLIKNSEYLHEINAYGLITNIRIYENKKKMQEIFGGFFIPANNDTIKALGVDTYPVLIQNGECQQ